MKGFMGKIGAGLAALTLAGGVLVAPAAPAAAADTKIKTTAMYTLNLQSCTYGLQKAIKNAAKYSNRYVVVNQKCTKYPRPVTIGGQPGINYKAVYTIWRTNVPR